MLHLYSRATFRKINDHFYCMWHVLYGYNFELYIFLMMTEVASLYIQLPPSLPSSIFCLRFISCKGK